MRHGITEQAIRTALRQRLAAHSQASGVLEEVNIELGTSRVDVLSLGESIDAYEIKSDFDTFDRLARQMHAYQRVFDHLTLVTTRAFLDQGQRLLPAWWGLMLAQETPRSVELQLLRAPTQNPRQQARYLAAMLWKDEATAIMRELAPGSITSRTTREDLCDQLTALGTVDQVRRWVVSQLRNRETDELRAIPAA